MRPLLLLALSLCCSLAARAADAPGTRDHPLVQRYEGAEIIGYDQRAFDSFTLPLGPVSRDGADYSLSPSQALSGAHTRLIYAAPAGRSPLEVAANYEESLKQAGFQVLYTCADEACGPRASLVRVFLYPSKARLKTTGDRSVYAFQSPGEHRFLAARLPRPEGDVYASVFVARETFTGVKDNQDRALVLLDVLETGAAMEQRMVTVDAAAMAADLAQGGRVSLYGVQFETGSAALKAESDPTLAEIATLLQQQPALKLFVVGHTDDVGAYSANLALSQRRAEAVVAALVDRLGVARDRLLAVGVGPVAPTAPNDGDDNRAKNRRVELVPQEGAVSR